MPLPPEITGPFAQAMNAQNFAAALELVRGYLRKKPTDGEAHDLAREALAKMNRHAEALFHAQRAAALLPKNLQLIETLSRTLQQNAKYADALKQAERMVQLAPNAPEGYGRVAACLVAMDRHVKVAKFCEQWLQRFPTEPELCFAYNNALLHQGLARESAAFTEKGLARNPDNAKLAAYKAITSCYVSPAVISEVVSCHRRFGELATASVPVPPFYHAPKFAGFVSAQHQPRLRVGFVSEDLRTHSVTYFLEPLLRHLDRDRFEVLVFSTNNYVDATTDRLASIVAEVPEEVAHRELNGSSNLRNWFSTGGMSRVDLAKLIYSQNIDVLIELMGLTHGSLWETMRLKPAPVQVTFLGYPSTTGLREIDYRIVDSITDPPGSDEHCVERLVRLDPCFLCYQPPQQALPEPALPDVPEGEIVFGSFNNLFKFNDELARVWARVLSAVPHSRLLMKSKQLSDPDVQAATLARIERAGVDPTRVTLLAIFPDRTNHLAAYGKMHIALDTFPYAGTTTTCEALLMGVPVVTYAPAGTLHAHRVGASILRAIGMPELIATTEDEYVRVAVELAHDTKRLADLRKTLRSRLLSSVICDQPGYAKRFADAISSMWTLYLRGGTQEAPST